MEIKPPRSQTIAASPIAGLSPSESVILFGDRIGPTHNKPKITDVRLPLSGQYTDLDGFAFDVLCSALGALEAAGELELFLRPEKLLFRMKDDVVIRQIRSPREWPSNSPEARIGAWLQVEPGGEAWLHDLVSNAMVPADTNKPHRTAYDFLVAGLMERGVVEAMERRAFLVFKVREYQVVSRWAADLRRVKQRRIDESLLCHRILGSEIRSQCADAWEWGIRKRTFNDSMGA